MRTTTILSDKVQLFSGETFTINFLRGSPSEVSLVAHTGMTATGNNAADLMAMGMKAYIGNYNAEVPTGDDYERYVKDVAQTKLATPAEMIHMTFLIRNVTRAWTHQAVRYRIGTAYIQESLRFLGHGEEYNILLTRENEKHLPDYVWGITEALRSYQTMIANGSPVQDARGVLPHHILTHMYWDMSLRTLMQVYNTRWCCQAQQDEWIPVLRQMKSEVRRYMGDLVADTITAPIDRGQSCGFNASFDRPCVWRQRLTGKAEDDGPNYEKEHTTVKEEEQNGS